MSKLRHFFRGYLKHYLVWTGLLLLGTPMLILMSVSDGSYVQDSYNSNPLSVVLAELDLLARIPFINAPIAALITLSICKGWRKLFGSKDSEIAELRRQVEELSSKANK